VGIGVEWYRIFGGGSVSLVKATLTEESKLDNFRRGNPDTCMDWEPVYSYKIETLEGQFYVGIAVWLPVVGEKEFRWAFLTTPGVELASETVPEAPVRGACFGSQCTGAGFTGHLCGGECKDLKNDIDNCGSCGHRCAEEEQCQANGSCACAADECHPRITRLRTLAWSWMGPVPAMQNCVHVFDATDSSQDWANTYVCSTVPGIGWYPNGTAPRDQVCTLFDNPRSARNAAWKQDALCFGRYVPGAVLEPQRWEFRYQGVRDQQCLPLIVPNESQWNDTYLCPAR
jgi:hypothetical protein